MARRPLVDIGSSLDDARRGRDGATGAQGPVGPQGPAGTDGRDGGPAMAAHLSATDPHPGYATDADLVANAAADRARANHTGTQLAVTISDFAATVLGTVLAGLSTASSAAVAATDTVLAAIGKLQAQVTLRALAARTIATTAPLSGGGDLTGDRTLSIAAATTLAPGSMSAADKAKLDKSTDGSYTPTYSNVANTSARTAYPAHYYRVGDMVHVHGRVDVTTVAGATMTQVKCDLPVASDITGDTDGVGIANAYASPMLPGVVTCDPATNVAQFYFYATAATTYPLFFQYSYRVR
jgi:hypothetical protein